MTQMQHEAFAAALEGLYEIYPLPEYKYRKVQVSRENGRMTAIRNARMTGDRFLVEMFAVKVPVAEIRNVHSLIYG